MKAPFLLALALSVNLAQARPVALAGNLGDSVEVEIDQAYIPAHGFDDNDNVQLVVEGRLPNACYTATEATARRASGSSVFRLLQSAHRNQSGVCAPGANLPPDLRHPVPFTSEISLGRLEAGSYRLAFGRNRERVFQVGIAQTGSVDDLRYATITNAFAEDSVAAASPNFEVRITGMLNSSCAVLAEPKLLFEGDVVVILLGTEQDGDYCLPVSHPFYEVLKVPTPPAGRYLLHVRSLGGQAKNKLFSVVRGNRPR